MGPNPSRITYRSRSIRRSCRRPGLRASSNCAEIVSSIVSRDPQKAHLRIGMLGLYGMPLPQLHFTGFETAFGEIAPRLAAAGHDVTIYCRGSNYPQQLRVADHKGVKLKYVPSPGGKNLSGLVATLFASLHALAFGRYDLFFFVNVGMGHHAALCR